LEIVVHAYLNIFIDVISLYPTKVSKETVEPSTQSRPRSSKWNKEHELALVYELLDLATKGVRHSFKGHFGTITENLNKRTEMDGVHYSRDQVKKKIENLKKNWKEFTDLLTEHIATGVGWNEVDNTVALDERQWQQLKSVSISLSLVVLKYKLVKLYSPSNTFILCCSNTTQINITDSRTAHRQTTPS
jgi:hypothetical protein